MFVAPEWLTWANLALMCYSYVVGFLCGMSLTITYVLLWFRSTPTHL